MAELCPRPLVWGGVYLSRRWTTRGLGFPYISFVGLLSPSLLGDSRQRWNGRHKDGILLELLIFVFILNLLG